MVYILTNDDGLVHENDLGKGGGAGSGVVDSFDAVSNGPEEVIDDLKWGWNPTKGDYHDVNPF